MISLGPLEDLFGFGASLLRCSPCWGPASLMGPLEAVLEKEHRLSCSNPGGGPRGPHEDCVDELRCPRRCLETDTVKGLAESLSVPDTRVFLYEYN